MGSGLASTRAGVAESGSAARGTGPAAENRRPGTMPDVTPEAPPYFGCFFQ